MSDSDDAGRRWIVGPPGPGEVSLQISCGDGFELTDEQEAALSRLLRSLEQSDPEVVGHTDCRLGGPNCDTLVSYPTDCVRLRCKSVSCTLDCGTFNKAAQLAGSTGWNLFGTFAIGS